MKPDQVKKIREELAEARARVEALESELVAALPMFRRRDIASVTLSVNESHSLGIGGWVFGAQHLPDLEQALADYRRYCEALGLEIGGAQ